jgi:transcriptional regulator GlxA family with amidase domain
VSAQDVAQVPMLLDRIAQLGIVTADAAGTARHSPPRPFVALWEAIRPMIERLYLTPTLQEIGEATGVSLRQVDRYVQDFVTAFALVGDGWRPTTRYLRLKLAILFSSAEDASVGEIARIVGYGSPDAMARAFRDAGLPPPSVVQERVRASAQTSA